MTLWQADLYRRPLQDEAGNSLWELVVCDVDRAFTATAFCPQSQVDSAWITQQLQQWIETSSKPDRLQVFRPQAASLLASACEPLGIKVEPTRRTAALKQYLQQRAKEYPQLPNYNNQPYEPVKLDKPAPLPLSESLWGDQWRFASIAAADLISAFEHRPIPIREIPDFLLPINLQIPSTTPIPGVIIDGGKKSMQLAKWLQRSRPVSLNYIPGQPDGLILEAGLVERWVLTTFEDSDVITAARLFRERQIAAKGLHFLLVQPDDSGMTYSGFWLLQNEVDR